MLRDCPRIVDPTVRDQQVARVALAQGGAIAAWQLRRAGVSKSVTTQWRARGRLCRKYRGVYAVGHPELSARGERFAALLAGGPFAALSHRTAGEIEAILPPGQPLEITVPRGRGTHDGLVVHRSRRLDRSEIMLIDGLRVTNPSRTLLDLVDVLDARGLRRAAEAAERLRLHAPPTPLPGRRLPPGPSPLAKRLMRSELERRHLELLLRHGAPLPAVGASLAGHEVDAYWPQAALVIELWSKAFHRHATAILRDVDRARDLKALGLTVLHRNWDDIVTDPRSYLAELHERVPSVPERLTG